MRNGLRRTLKRIRRTTTNPRPLLARLLTRSQVALRRSVLFTRPRTLYVETTNLCNLRCIMCQRSHGAADWIRQNGGYMSREIFDRIEPSFPFAEWVYLGGFGETLLHKDFIWMLERIKEKGPKVIIFTNGIELSKDLARRIVEAQLDEMEVSIDGATPDTYRRIRGRDLDQLLVNLRTLIEIKQSCGSTLPHLTLQLVAMRDNVHEVPALVELAAAIGVTDVSIANMAVHADHLREQSLYLNQEAAARHFALAERRAHELGIALALPSLAETTNDCTRFFDTLYIAWDGRVTSCDLDRHLVGDLRNETIEEIWNGSKLRKLREEYFRHGIASVCPNCYRVESCARNYLYPVEMGDDRRAK